MSCGDEYTEEEVLAMDLVRSIESGTRQQGAGEDGGPAGGRPTVLTCRFGDTSEHRNEDEAGACTWEHTFGGQAVIEGVMMRGRAQLGNGRTRPSGDIAQELRL